MNTYIYLYIYNNNTPVYICYYLYIYVRLANGLAGACQGRGRMERGRGVANGGGAANKNQSLVEQDTHTAQWTDVFAIYRRNRTLTPNPVTSDLPTAPTPPRQRPPPTFHINKKESNKNSSVVADIFLVAYRVKKSKKEKKQKEKKCDKMRKLSTSTLHLYIFYNHIYIFHICISNIIILKLFHFVCIPSDLYFLSTPQWKSIQTNQRIFNFRDQKRQKDMQDTHRTQDTQQTDTKQTTTCFSIT